MEAPKGVAKPRTARWTLLLLVLFALILIPFVLFADRMDAFAHRIFNDQSSRGVVAAGVIGLLGGDIFLPVPSSLVSTAAGLFLGLGPGAAASWLGMTIACIAGYWTGRLAGNTVVRRFVSEDGLEQASDSFSRWGDWAIIASRPVPMLAEASVIAAGALRRPFGRFLLLSSLSNLAVSVVYAAVGAYSFKSESFIAAFLGAILLPWIAMRLAGRSRRTT